MPPDRTRFSRRRTPDRPSLPAVIRKRSLPGFHLRDLPPPGRRRNRKPDIRISAFHPPFMLGCFCYGRLCDARDMVTVRSDFHGHGKAFSHDRPLPRHMRTPPSERAAICEVIARLKGLVTRYMSRHSEEPGASGSSCSDRVSDPYRALTRPICAKTDSASLRAPASCPSDRSAHPPYPCMLFLNP